MKKFVCILLAAMLLLLSACSGGGFKPAVYRMNDSYPRISLKEDGSFVFVHGASASRMTLGTYTVEGNEENTALKLECEDGETVYYFDVTEDSIVFDGENSIPIFREFEDESEITDGTEFDLWREYK